MGFYDAIRVGASGAAGDFTVDRSLRFERGDSTYLQATLGDGNEDKWTWSGWVKKTVNGQHQNIFSSGSDSYYTIINFDNNDKLKFQNWHSAQKGTKITTRVFRDNSAWMHIVVIWDSGNSTADDRIKIYVNGTRETSFSSSTNPDQNQDSVINGNSLGGSTYGEGKHFVGKFADTSDNSSTYKTEINFVDGQAYDPSYFAETNADTGQWNPKKYVGSYGTNGFYLNFSDNSGTTATTLGKDSSGNGNNFTPNNFAVSDAVKDTPTNNFCTLNPLSRTNKTESEGNLETRANDDAWRTGSTTFHMSSGKWYWEIHITAIGTYQMNGIVPAVRQNGTTTFNADIYIGSYSDEWGYRNEGTLYNSANPTSSWGATYTTGDILSFALDMDNGTLDIKKNNSATGSQITGISTTKEYRPAFTNWATSSITNVNFGQDSSFAGEKTAQGNTDGSGQGDFYYTPPSGYKALCSANLPDPTILLPNKHFDTLLYTGNGSGQTLSGLNFSPDWLWIKSRSSTEPHELNDQVRGTLKSLSSNSTAAENTASGRIEAFTSDGFTVGNSGNVNSNSETFVAWNWNAGETDSATYTVKVVSDGGNKYRFNNFGTSAVTLDLAEGGTYTFDQSDSSMSSHPMQLSTTANGTHGGGSAYSTGVTYQLDGSTVTASAYISGFSSASSRKLIITVAASAPTLYYYCYYHSGMGGAVNTNSTLGSSNFAGSIQSTAKVNASAGFSITAYSGNGSNAQTIGHGLGVAPDVIILKARGASQNWRVWHKSLAADGSKRLLLDSTNASEDASFLNDTAPTSTVFTLGNSDDAWNASGGTYITYLFSEVAGYSKFGKYTGNGNADGTFVFTGFRVSWLMVKKSSGSDSWLIMDNKRDIDNVVGNTLAANSSGAENADTGGIPTDFLSNGFKCRGSGGDFNGSGSTFVYLAFAESPFKNARAR